LETDRYGKQLQNEKMNSTMYLLYSKAHV